MLFNKNQPDNKIQRLDEIWNDALEGISYEIENEAFSLCFEIISADNTNKEVKWKLGACYLYGIGCEEDTQKAKTLFLETVDENEYSWIYKLLGNLSYNNEEEDAVHFYSKYLEKHTDDKEAVMFLADCYKNGIGSEIDNDKALDLYISLSETEFADNIDFQRKYGFMLADIKSSECLIWLRKATELGCSSSAHELAKQFMEADYLPFDPYTPTFRINKAIYYLLTAIELGKDENRYTEAGTIAMNSYNILMCELGLPQLQKGEI